ncbi:PaaI family thioesterase [Nocardia shimofusensis]|uniref:PaaI family thioesterase n=1 Tax=Nocardia shimofusensis TaxID=228596 RepID=UPI000834E9F4|nr:PaaI family thioesterase [Nocardia shimofusensis]
MQIIFDDIDAAEIDRRIALYGPLTQAVRELVDATIRTEADEDTIRDVEATIRVATARLREKQIEGSFGARYTADGTVMSWGNAAVGVRNPIAPPMVVERDDTGLHWAEITLGAAYEGPPGLVHGGVTALLLDQILGHAAAVDGKPSFTGTLTLRYRRPTPLGKVRAEARVDRVEGVKTFVVGSLSTADGLTVEADGVFIQPAWVRDRAE